jgi:hypothetical protein
MKLAHVIGEIMAQEITTQDIQENKNTIQEEKINRKRMSEKLVNKVL